MKILGTGLQGLIGSRIVALLSSEYTFENLSRTTGVDITNADAVKKAIEQSDADIVLHVAAKADVDGCEKDKSLGEMGEAWKVNVKGTQHIAQGCEMFGKKLIYVSTDFVFDGEKEFYTEEDKPNPINWYATTKFEGEQIVQAITTPWIIARIAYPYRNNFPKNDFVRAIKGKLENNEPISMVTDHIMTPTFIDDIA
ncbi:MAG: NAD(P)-dependent oxidoreductase, partial [Candidatus Levybacteria bacterium]|nr:NAD(P)-dependent oxidoreductase [Candidatus Levybacteria bacterium]